MEINDTEAQWRIDRAIEKLWSPSDLERQEGKRAILDLGSCCVAPLLSLLRDLITDPSPRFPSGKETKGTSALSCPQATRSESSFRTVSDLAINGRLLLDVVELMGALHAEIAVPALIEVLEGEHAAVNFTSRQYIRPEMAALCEIGRAAVPALLELVTHVERHAANAISYPVVISMASQPQMVNPEHFSDGALDEDDPLEEAADTESEGEQFEGPYDILAQRIVARAAMVLGEIGDGRALPALKEIFEREDCLMARSYVAEAIQKIEAKLT